MTFDKLADRCLLFVEERKQMVVELLKEAELEMTRKTNMYEDTREYTCDGSTSYGLPDNYKQIIFIQYDGTKLYALGEDEVSYDSSGDIQDGEPTGYFIRNNGIHLDYKSSSGKIKISYYGTLDGAQDNSTDPSPIIPNMFHRDLCDYAIAISAAKDNPQLHDKHWSLWLHSLDGIINEDADRELNHSIKREI